MSRVRLKEDHELSPKVKAVVQDLDAKGVDTANLRGFAHCQEMFDSYFQFYGPARKGRAVEVMNNSINQTLRRTILTSMTTLLVVATLLLIGGEVIKGFSTALFIGILVGTYSSIFIASPVVLGLGISRDDMLPVKKDEAEADGLP